MERDRSFWSFLPDAWSRQMRIPQPGLRGNSSRRPAMPGGEPVFLCKVAPNAACISNFAHCYLITDCKRVSGQHLDATEDLEIVVMSAEETKKLMTNGGLVQAVHVAAMYYAEKLLNK